MTEPLSVPPGLPRRDAERLQFLCAPNFSEGRRPEVLEAIADAVRAVSDAGLDARLIDYSADVDHNRSVLTILGDADGVLSAVIATSEIALREIDLRTHTGVHPRAGAIDVIPVIPLLDASRGAAVALAASIGDALASKHMIPIYFYEWNAATARRRALPNLRRGGFEALAAAKLQGDRAPDLGPNAVHPTGGAVVVGARAPLVAYNVNLTAPDPDHALAVARTIAGRIRRDRERLPYLAGVRALGLYLDSRSRAQVSMNLTRPLESPLPAVFDYIQQAAGALGVDSIDALESEIIGVIPAVSMAGAPPERIHWRGFRSSQILDEWLRT